MTLSPAKKKKKIIFRKYATVDAREIRVTRAKITVPTFRHYYS